MNIKRDISNQKFGKITALFDDGTRDKHGKILWYCKCDCGNEKYINCQSLTRNLTKSCGCVAKSKEYNINDKYGELLIVDILEKSGSKKIKVLCSCGNIFEMFASSLKINKNLHCGCKNGPKITDLPEYSTWSNIKQRCYNPKTEHFEFYGGRGIRVCERWINSFENFYKDIGQKPSNKFWIERKDVNGDYSPENCYWAEISQQQHNRNKMKNTSSKFIGVCYRRDSNTWRADIGKNKIRYHFGIFDFEEDAAYAYNVAAPILFGEFCKLNELNGYEPENASQIKEKVENSLKLR